MTSKNLILNYDSGSLVSYNLQTKQYFVHQIFHKSDSPHFFDQFQRIFNLKQVKAFLFTFELNEFSTFINEYNFRLKCKKFCQRHEIPYCFPFQYCLFASFSISSTKTMVKEGEHVLVIALIASPSPNVPLTSITIVKREKEDYRIVKIGVSIFQPFTQEWKNHIYEGCTPKKIILVQASCNFGADEAFANEMKMKNFFNNVSFESIPFVDRISFLLQCAENLSHLNSEKFNQYYVRPSCDVLYEVKMGGKSLMKTESTDAIPFEKSVVVDVNRGNNVSLYCTFAPHKPSELVKEIKLLEFKTKKVKIILKFDIDSFYDFKVEPFVGDEEEAKANVAEKLCKGNNDDDKKTTEEEAKKNDKENDVRKPALIDPEAVVIDKPVILEKAQMIFDKQNFFVSYFANGKQYNVNDSDGEAKTPIYIAFTEKKPIVGKSAMEIYFEKPKFVVFDLIELCSVSTEDISNPKWGFKLSKEEEKGDSLCLAFETFKGEKLSTVEFLLAIILKNGKDRIKKETGKKFEEIEIKFNGFSPTEVLKKNFVEAAKLLKINIVFV